MPPEPGDASPVNRCHGAGGHYREPDPVPERKSQYGGICRGNALSRAGVISGFDMTTEAALTKLHMLLSQRYTSPQVRALMQQDLKGELTLGE